VNYDKNRKHSMIGGDELLKIVIRHIPNTLNYGSAMMAEKMMHYLNSMPNDNVEFFCAFSSEENKRRMTDATKLRRISTDKVIKDREALPENEKGVHSGDSQKRCQR